MMPRGARSVSVRWWLFSAISLNLACCTTWKNQNPQASRPNATPIATLNALRRVVSRRRSSAIAINVIIVSKTGRRDACRRNPETTRSSGTRPPRQRHFRTPGPRIDGVGDGNCRRSSSAVEPHENGRVQGRGHQQQEEPRQRGRNDELGAQHARQEADHRSSPGRQSRGCRSPARPGSAPPRCRPSAPVTGPDLIATYTTTINTRSIGVLDRKHVAGQRRLRGEGDEDRRERGGASHCTPSDAPRDAGGVRTISTSSSRAKSTAGRTVIS